MPKKIILFGIPLITLLFTFTLPIIIDYLIQNDFQSFQDIFIKAFNSRYNSSDNNLLYFNTILLIPGSPVIGYGFSFLPFVFIGDSVYVDVLYQAGIFGLIIYILILKQVVNNIYDLLILLILAAGINYIFSIVFLPMLIMNYDKSKLKNL